MAVTADTVAATLVFPEPGLDDPAAYQGYSTRVFRDARGNALQVYLNARGRMVALWADAADESAAFTARDSSGHPAALAWGPPRAVVGAGIAGRSVAWALAGPPSVTLGLFLLGSMRVERDFAYALNDTLPLDADPFPRPELTALIGNLERVDSAERRRDLALLRAGSVAELRSRLAPVVTATTGDSTWVVDVAQESFDGKHHLRLTLAGDSRRTRMTTSGAVVSIRSLAGDSVRFTVRVATDAPALEPLGRDEMFSDEFRRFVAAAAADTAHPERARRLEREIRGMELLSYREKLMAGLPNFATYFGRDMLMTALMMRPIWAPTMPEHVIASALGKLSPAGEVSHEEALGGQAIREHAAQYNRLMAEYDHIPASRKTARQRALARARAELAGLDATRENYVMIDNSFQLPVVAAEYLADPRVPARRKRDFLLADGRLARLFENLLHVARAARPYARSPVATNLVSFPRAPDGSWISASWRDSRAGYGGGRFALDVNAIWVPHALAAIGTILDALHAAGFDARALDSLAPALRDPALARYARDRRALERDVGVWRGAERHFAVTLPPAEVAARVAARTAALEPAERQYWDSVARTVPPDTLRFFALSLDSAGRPIPIVNTDPASWLLLDSLDAGRAAALLDPIVRRYPVGLLIDGVGPVVSNDAYATPPVWRTFAHDAYHSPTVIWGREVNLLLAGLALEIGRLANDSARAALVHDLRRLDDAAASSGLRHEELWSYRIENGRLVPERYGASSDVQLWSLTDLAVQFLLARVPSR
ncbi:MAG TPA: hypothetical protein VFK78_10260 [Gemmatimonadales bacterium]|nr:hypothetical protein [Gemmatimonadales bacterium]